MSEEATTPLQKHQGKVLTNFGFPLWTRTFLFQAIRMHKLHTINHPMMINLLKNLSGNVVRVDLVVLKIVVHESVLQSMKDSSIMAPLRQEWRQRHLALHITQV